jgi:hypothetical protein
MYYCSIEDAWGNNFNKKHFNYKSNYKSNLIQENTINEEDIDNINENIPHSLDHQLDNTNTIQNNTISNNTISNQIKSNKTDLIKNKRISLEQQIEKKIEKIYKMKDKKNKLIEKTQLLKLNGGNSQSDTNNYILLGLVLLFIIDVFGNLSY